MDKAQKMYDLCEEFNWIPVSMKNDWKTIYAEGVKYVGKQAAEDAEGTEASEAEAVSETTEGAESSETEAVESEGENIEEPEAETEGAESEAPAEEGGAESTEEQEEELDNAA